MQTIRAFGGVPREIATNHAYGNALNRTTYMSAAANRWLSVRLESLGTILIFATASVAIASVDSISPSLTGLVLSYANAALRVYDMECASVYRNRKSDEFCGEDIGILDNTSLSTGRKGWIEHHSTEERRTLDNNPE